MAGSLAWAAFSESSHRAQPMAFGGEHGLLRETDGSSPNIRSLHMSRRRLLLVFVLLALEVGQASAGIIFGKKNKPSPNDPVPEFLSILKTHPDEHNPPPPPPQP